MSQSMSMRDTFVLLFAGVGVLSAASLLFSYATNGTSFPCYCQTCQGQAPIQPQPVPPPSKPTGGDSFAGGFIPTGFSDPESVWGPFTYFVVLLVMFGFAFLAYWLQKETQSTRLYQQGQSYFQQ